MIVLEVIGGVIVVAIDSPLGQGETQDWMTWRQRDQKQPPH
jgi:hypothetical protein